jgi:hypothetical protein
VLLVVSLDDGNHFHGVVDGLPPDTGFLFGIAVVDRSQHGGETRGHARIDDAADFETDLGRSSSLRIQARISAFSVSPPHCK